ncbi:hypothetical protein DFH09DRAFT_1301938 [Mycena vulgaris]|nr:hypothetical protein DFH09DRAFT_1327205 [Mycena vulgaris]KAJ6601740.1 hypothetical protein DFH09DRAFT_1301938 [Mycena vulgaris]
MSPTHNCDPRETVSKNYASSERRSSSSDSLSTVSDSNDEKSDAPQQQWWCRRRTLDRFQCAICRVLSKRYNIPHSDTDVHKDREFLGPDFHKTLDPLIDKKKREEKPRTRSRSGHGSKKSINAEHTGRDRDLRTRPATPVTTISTHAMSTAFSVENSMPDEDFIRIFIADVCLELVWHVVLKSAGLTEGKMRKLAAIPKQHVEQFVAKAFPDMRDVDQVLFTNAILGLAK